MRLVTTWHQMFLESAILTLIYCTVPKGDIIIIIHPPPPPPPHHHEHDTHQAEAEPPPTFRWLDAENQPVTDGQVVNDQYKVLNLDHQP